MEKTVIKTAGRVFEVLEYFSDVRKPLSVREIAEHFGYPSSSSFVLIRSIASLGYLTYDQKLRAYFPSVRLAMLGEWVYEMISSGGGLRPMLTELAERTDETVILTVQNDIYSQYIEVIPSSQPLQLYVRPGTRRLMCDSGSGWAMMAVQSDDAIKKTVHRTNLRLNKNETKIDTASLMARIKEIRKKGYAFSRGVVTPGAGVISIALPNEGIGTLAVGVAGVLDRLEPFEAKVVRIMKDLLRKYTGYTSLRDRHNTNEN